MTRNKDFKKLVRARMVKTGESYAAARAQLREAPAPTHDEYADLAGMSDEAVQKKTGHDWLEWVQTLDELGAAERSHRDIASLVRERWPAIGGWWAQSVTVGYERIRGLRVKGQMSTGDHAANKSRTFAVPVGRLFAAATDDLSWLGASPEIRTTTPERSLRLRWPDGTLVSLGFIDKGPTKSTLTVQHRKLPDTDRRDAEKAAWADRLDRLATSLDARAST
jgi:uncharacterized protein YndB with AHSA1/START domain